MAIGKGTIYISYFDDIGIEQITAQIRSAFKARDITSVKTRKDISYREYLPSFVENIVDSEAVILIINDKYLRDETCMFELLQIYRTGQLLDRMFPILLDDVSISRSQDRIKLVKFWQEQTKQLESDIRDLDTITNLEGITEDLNLLQEIRTHVSKLTSVLKDINALNVTYNTKIDFGELVQAVLHKLEDHSTLPITNKKHFPDSIRQNPAPIMVRNRFDYESKIDVNDLLIDTICESLAIYNPDLDIELNKVELDIPSIKREIVDCFPFPIGEPLRKLFTRSSQLGKMDDMEKFSLPRLEQIQHTQSQILQFVAQILLSQLWDAKQNKNFKFTAEEKNNITAFFDLGFTESKRFSYDSLIQTCLKIFQRNQIQPFISEMQSRQVGESYGDAILFFNDLVVNTPGRSYPEDAFGDLCLAAEEHLGNIINCFSFLVKYKLVSIKDIELIKFRHEIPKFRHNQITLNRALTIASTGISEIGMVFDNFMDNKSVLFFKSTDRNIDDYLNLSPFIIDQNAQLMNYSTKLYMYRYVENHKYYYSFINNPLDEYLEISDQNLSHLKQSFVQCKMTILDIEKNENLIVTDNVKGKSRFLRKR